MSKCNVYDENVMLRIRRKGVVRNVPFYKLRDGDIVLGEDGEIDFTCEGDAHMSSDTTYEGWLVYSREAQESFFPEDFGAKLKE